MTVFAPIPAPTPVIIHLLAHLPILADDVGDRVSIALDPVLPALRVSQSGYTGAAATDWEAAPMFQVEVWATDALEAERIAWNIANHWTTATLEIIGPAAVHGRWVIQNPYPLPANDRDAEDTNLARFVVNLAIRLTGASHG